jgi:hypothetical protein
LGAQVAISRYQTKQSAIAELQSIRATLLICYSIINKFGSLKRQQVRPLRNRYVQARQEFDAAVAAANAGQPGGPHQVLFDLQTLTPVKVPTDMVSSLMPDKVFMGGRGLAAALELIGAVDAVERAIAYRNALIADAEVKGMNIEKYFGLKTAVGVTDEKFKSNVEMLFLYTDDCIFFAKQLSEDLLAYGNGLRRRYHRRLYRLGIAKFLPADWSIAESENLIPSTDDYQRWLRGFKKPPSRLGRLKARLLPRK